MPFFGAVDVACLGSDGDNALPGIPKLVDALARRLQTQHRLTEQICHALAGKTEGAAVRLKGTYLCSMARGLESRESRVDTTAFSGGFRPDRDLQRTFPQPTG